MHALKKTIMAFALIALLTPQQAGAGVEDSYDPSAPRAVTPWYGYVGPAEEAATRRFIDGMRPHHAGALTMSADYLADPAAANARLIQLARGIIHNQEFEIGMLDSVQAHLDAAAGQPPGIRRVATEGLAQQQRFFRAPPPGPLDAWAGPRTASARDVQFAKAMIIHHEGALVMARDYLNDRGGRNGYLRQMCRDILLDQQNEIDLMHAVIAAYPGNPDDVTIDASMIHGMEGMAHHMPGHHSGHQNAPENRHGEGHHHGG